MNIKCLLVFLNVIRVLQCTIDMKVTHFQYIANHLTIDDCRRLVASLHFLSYELPESLEDAQKVIPEEETCIGLLLDWNGGKEKWQGAGRTHQDVALRLRQLGCSDVADWLGLNVFHQLVKDVNESLQRLEVTENFEKPKEIVKNFKADNYEKDDEWAIFHSTFSMIFVGLLGMLVLNLLRNIHLVCKAKSITNRRMV